MKYCEKKQNTNAQNVTFARSNTVAQCKFFKDITFA